MKQFHWLLCVAKNFDWSRKIAPLSNLTRAPLLVEWTYSESRIELRNLQILKNARKIKSVFVIGVALWAEKLGRCLENYKRWKNTLGKLGGCGQPRGHLIRILNERSVNQVTVEIFVFCVWWFSNKLNIVSETHFSCDTVGRELWLAILSSLLCPETDRNIRIGEQGYVFYFITHNTRILFHKAHLYKSIRFIFTCEKSLYSQSQLRTAISHVKV